MTSLAQEAAETINQLFKATALFAQSCGNFFPDTERNTEFLHSRMPRVFLNKKIMPMKIIRTLRGTFYINITCVHYETF